MLHLQNISFEFGGHYLFKNIDWFIKPRERIALVGKNGAGKSTLLKLIIGKYEIREGNLNKQGGMRIGYLSQDMISEDGSKSVLDTAMMAFSEQLEIQSQIDDLLLTIETDHSDENIQRLADLQEDFARLDGYTMESRTAEILEGLGFKTAELNRPLKEFSGGWRMRVILARMLLEQPDIMLMDEPTNHLDLPSIEWLEGYLNGYPGSVVIVSHDREFLNKLTNKTAELSNSQLYLWEGNYDFFLKAKVERDSLLERKIENQKQYIKDQEKFINRFKAKASKAKAVQSRIKMLDKLDTIEEIPQDNSRINIDFKVAQKSGKVVMELEGIEKSFGDKNLFNGVDIEIERGDKIALIGANGTGKSTFLRIIANAESFKGKRKEGHNVQPSFYAQHQLESLDLKSEILEELKHADPKKTDTELRAVLGCFLFSGDDVFKQIKVLSGGEKARVALAKTLVSEANFLLLDEPTNHLDIDSIELLIDALARYEGTLIFVSHNRYFIQKLANKIWWIENEDVKMYPGTFEEYHIKQTEIEKSASPSPTKVEKTKSTQKNKTVISKEEKELKQLNQQLKVLEKQIEELSAEKSALEQKLLDSNELSHEEIGRIGNSVSLVQEKIVKLQSQCDDLIEDIILLEVES